MLGEAPVNVEGASGSHMVAGPNRNVNSRGPAYAAYGGQGMSLGNSSTAAATEVRMPASTASATPPAASASEGNLTDRRDRVRQARLDELERQAKAAQSAAR